MLALTEKSVPMVQDTASNKESTLLSPLPTLANFFKVVVDRKKEDFLYYIFNINK